MASPCSRPARASPHWVSTRGAHSNARISMFDSASVPFLRPVDGLCGLSVGQHVLCHKTRGVVRSQAQVGKVGEHLDRHNSKQFWHRCSARLSDTLVLRLGAGRLATLLSHCTPLADHSTTPSLCFRESENDNATEGVIGRRETYGLLLSSGPTTEYKNGSLTSPCSHKQRQLVGILRAAAAALSSLGSMSSLRLRRRIAAA